MRGKIEIWGEYEIINGDKRVKGRNKILPKMAQYIINVLAGVHPSTVYLFANSWTMGIGSDTNTPTNSSMTDLVNLISKAPDSQTGSTNKGDGEHTITFTATWNAGSVSGTIGEVGLYTKCSWAGSDGLLPFGHSTGTSTDSDYNLVSRMSVADNEFASFEINTSAPLTINYTLHVAHV